MSLRGRRVDKALVGIRWGFSVNLERFETDVGAAGQRFRGGNH